MKRLIITFWIICASITTNGEMMAGPTCLNQAPEKTGETGVKTFKFIAAAAIDSEVYCSATFKPSADDKNVKITITNKNVNERIDGSNNYVVITNQHSKGLLLAGDTPKASYVATTQITVILKLQKPAKDEGLQIAYEEVTSAEDPTASFNCPKDRKTESTIEKAQVKGIEVAFDAAVECSYIITAPEGSQVTVKITQYDPPSKETTKDFLELREGSVATGDLLLPLADVSQGKTATSKGNQLFVKSLFSTLPKDKGYIMEYSAVSPSVKFGVNLKAILFLLGVISIKSLHFE